MSSRDRYISDKSYLHVFVSSSRRL